MGLSNDPGDDEAKLDMTPMIDVTFLLLIFFMVATKFKTHEGSLKSYLPKDRGMSASSASPDLKEVRVVLLWNGSACVMKVNKQVYGSVVDEDGETSPDYGQLVEDLKHIASTYNNPAKPDGQPVILDAKAQVPVKHVIAALNACQIAGIKDITYARAGQAIE